MNESENAILKAKWQNWQEAPMSLSVSAMHDVRYITCHLGSFSNYDGDGGHEAL